MSVETFDVSKDVISVTPEAAQHLKSQVQAKGASAVRISVKESGCTGYMYVMEEVDSGEAEDVTVDLHNGVNVYVDAGSIGFLLGTELDYVRVRQGDQVLYLSRESLKRTECRARALRAAVWPTDQAIQDKVERIR